MAAHVLLHAAVFAEHLFVGGYQAVHVAELVEPVVALCGVGYVFAPLARTHPAVYVALRRIDDELYLGEKLLARTVA